MNGLDALQVQDGAFGQREVGGVLPDDFAGSRPDGTQDDLHLVGRGVVGVGVVIGRLPLGFDGRKDKFWVNSLINQIVTVNSNSVVSSYKSTEPHLLILQAFTQSLSRTSKAHLLIMMSFSAATEARFSGSI